MGKEEESALPGGNNELRGHQGGQGVGPGRQTLLLRWLPPELEETGGFRGPRSLALNNVPTSQLGSAGGVWLSAVNPPAFTSRKALNPKLGPLSARPSHQPVPVPMETISGVR